ncbi:MAG: hypothetical protein NUV70_08450 [Caldiserica bacterium]|jgi:hypothetical protein|nr:hypothetical protein [Caldisericota bacterium]
MESLSKAVLALLKFSDRPGEATALARSLLRRSLTETQYRALLVAVGAFAKDNESYFLRYDDIKATAANELLSQFESWLASVEAGGDALYWLIFRKPNEPRMRAAYDVLAGWVLKFLYQTRGAIPVDYADGQAKIWLAQPLPSKEIWDEFIRWFLESRSEVLESNIATLLNFAPKKPIGAVPVPDHLFEPVSDALMKAIQKNSRLLGKFQTSAKVKWQRAQTNEERKTAICEGKKATSRSPFEVTNTPSLHTATAGQGTRSCITCLTDSGIAELGTRLVFPESKKVWYDEPGRNLQNRGVNPPVCPECFFAAMISGFYPSEAYSVCELPVASAYQTFLLAQRLSNVTVSLGAMAIARSSLLTVIPSKYFLVRLTTGRGALPKKTQLYLLLADYSPSFPGEGSGIQAYVEAAGAINYLSIHLDVLRVLNLFRRGDVLPPHFVTEGNAKARANDAVRLLEAGKPYAALYRLLYDAFQNAKKGWFGERSLFKSPNTLGTFDKTVQQGARTLLKFLLRGGESEMLIKDPGTFYRDVKDLSDALYDLLQPIAQYDVNQSGSNVSVVVRKFVEAVEKRFPQLNLVELQYMVAEVGDKAEKQRTEVETVYVKGKERLQQDLDKIEGKINEMYEKYFQNGSAYIWREFIKEVSQRLLARLLLGVRASKGGGSAQG